MSDVAAAPAPVPSPVPIAERPARLLSLDAFRGITIAGMLLVNNPGSWGAIYGPLKHADWHGWTPTDFIFPFFLFIVGVAMTYSFAKLLERGANRRELMVKAAKRALVLFGLGLVLHGFPDYDLATIRIPGVLQRIAIAYFIGTGIVLAVGWRGQAVTAAALLLGYWAIMMLVPVPGGAAGVLDRGQDLGAYIDRAVFGTQHLWSASRTWDPEGLLSTLPAIASLLVGVLTGHWIRSGRTATVKVTGMLAAGAVGLLAGWLWGLSFPINKPLWTSSYVVFTGGWALLFLGACYWLIDVKGYRAWAAPFVVYGMNAIAAFFLSSLVARLLVFVLKVTPADGGDPIALKTHLYQTFFASWLQPINASLAYALAYVIFWLGIMWLMHRRKIYIKV
jgi:predicted acyltransferase